jgi:cellulose synthase/poly-beta-1,6-N-acetylglucosamine synthase-like glycosyltransferase
MTIDISVVVPTKNRPQSLERCVDALRRQDFDPDRYEVIVVHDDRHGATSAGELQPEPSSPSQTTIASRRATG